MLKLDNEKRAGKKIVVDDGFLMTTDTVGIHSV